MAEAACVRAQSFASQSLLLLPLTACCSRLLARLLVPPAEPYRLYNLDVFEYLPESPFGLYGAIPFMLAHRPGQSVGVLWWVLLLGMLGVLALLC